MEALRNMSEDAKREKSEYIILQKGSTQYKARMSIDHIQHYRITNIVLTFI